MTKTPDMDQTPGVSARTRYGSECRVQGPKAITVERGRAVLRDAETKLTDDGGIFRARRAHAARRYRATLPSRSSDSRPRAD